MEQIVYHWPDIAALLIVSGFTAYGYKRGIVRMVIFLAGFAAAAVLAAFVSSISCEYVYLHAVQPAVVSALRSNISSAAQEYDPKERIKELLEEKDITLSEEQEKLLFGDKSGISDEAEEEIRSLLTEEEFCGTINSVFAEYCAKLTESLSGVLPEEISEKAEEYLEKSGSRADDKLSLFRDGGMSAAELIEREVIRPVMIKTVRNVIFAVVFAAVTFAFALLSRAFGILREIDLIKAPDAFLGGLLGFLCGLLFTAVFALLCGIIIQLSSDGWKYLNGDVLAGTYFFKYIYAAVFILITFLLGR